MYAVCAIMHKCMHQKVRFSVGNLIFEDENLV